MMPNELLQANPGTERKDHAGRVEVIDNGGRLAPGEYWRLKAPLLVDGKEVSPDGDVLLIADVKRDGDVDHRVDLHYHPRENLKDGRIKLLTHEFFDLFEPISHAEAAAIRERELAELQRQSVEVQEQITRAQREPGYLNQRCQAAIAQDSGEEKGGLPARLSDNSALNILDAEQPTLTQALTTGANELVRDTLVAVQSAHRLAMAQGEWFSERAGTIAKITQQMVPFYQERALVPIAQTKRVLESANKLLRDVKTLTLFTGDEISVRPIIVGELASAGTGVTLYQAKLWMDEEISVFDTYFADDVTGENAQSFVAALEQHPQLLDRLIPAQRGAVLIAATRHHTMKIPEDEHPLVKHLMRDMNECNSLMVRDGRSAWLVSLPIESHQKARRLFPELDLDGSVFSGLNGSRVTPADLAWTDRLSDLETMAIHYRRFAITLAGLISRGAFWEGVNFEAMLTAHGQGAINFVRDDSGEMTLGHTAPSFTDYLNKMAMNTRPGSVVILDQREALRSENAPYFFKGDDQPEGDKGAIIHTQLERHKHSLKARVTVGIRSYRDRSSKTGYVELHNGANWTVDPGRAWMCIDRIDPEDLDRLINTRKERQRYTDYIHLFRVARDLALERRKQEAPLIERVVEDLRAGNIEADRRAAEGMVAEALAARRSAKLPQPVPGGDGYQDLLDHVYRLSAAGAIPERDVEAFCLDRGVQPLRLSTSAKGITTLHTTPLERENRGGIHKDVERHRIERTSKGITAKSMRLELLTPAATDETVQKEWEGAEAWRAKPLARSTLPARKALIAAIEQSHNLLPLLTRTISRATYKRLLSEAQSIASEYVDEHSSMPHMVMRVPFAILGASRSGSIVLELREDLWSMIDRGVSEEVDRAERISDLVNFWTSVDAKKGYIRGECSALFKERDAGLRNLKVVAYRLTARNKSSPSGIAASPPSALNAYLTTDAWKTASNGSDTFFSRTTRHLPGEVEAASRALGKMASAADLKFDHDTLPAELRHFAPGWDQASSDPLMRWVLSGNEGAENARR